MIRTAVIVCLLGSVAAATLRNSGANKNGFCFGYKSDSSWCWLSTDGLELYVKDGSPYKCAAFNGYKSSDYCENAKKNAHKSQSHTLGKRAQRSRSTPWSKYLASLAGKRSSAFSWQTACKKLGQSPSGYSMGSGSGKTTFHLTCDSNKIDVVCRGNPFSSCMSTYKPPAVASDSPPPGSYAKTVGNRGCTRFSAAETQVFLDIHNKMRCAVGAPAVVWDGALACQAQKTQDRIGTNGMHHSKSYEMPIPAGENLATGTSPLNAAWMWFTEYLETTNYASGKTGHYNAMSWKSVEKIGCGVGKSGKGIVRCQYAGTSKATAPNFGGQKEYRANLSPFHGSPSDFTKCGLTVSEVKGKASLYKKWGILRPRGTMARNIGMYSVTDAIWSNASPTAFFSACAFMGAAAMVTIGVALRRSRSPAASQDDRELLSVEAAEGLE